MEFFDVPADRAAEFRDHVIAREPYHLRDLASWMDQTGGPLDEMDASVASLVPLWEWCLDLARADFLGLTEGLVPATDPGLSSLADPEFGELMRQSDVVGDRLMHYLRLVVGRLHPPTQWGVYRSSLGRRDHAHHQTALLLPGFQVPREGAFALWVHPVLNAVAVAIQRNRDETDRLQAIVVPALPPGLTVGDQDRLPSVLRPYLDADLPPAPEEARTSPVAVWLAAPAPVAPQVPAGREPGSWSETILARGPAEGLEDLALLAPLPADRVATALREGGFRDLTEADVLAEADLTHPDGVAHLMTAVHRGRLRAVHLEPVDPDEETWERLMAPLRMLALELGANLVDEGDYPD